MLTGVHHVTLRVDDLARSRTFYETILGLWCDQDFAAGEVEAHPGGRLRFRLGELTRLTLKPAADQPTLSAGLDHVAVAVDSRQDLEELAARLREAGAETEGVQSVAEGDLLSFQDPDGTRLEFFHQGSWRTPGLAAFIVPVEKGRVLLARNTYATDQWGFVGGMAEAGEAIDEAARREALEESGLKLSTDRLIAVGDRSSLVFFVFVGRVLGGDQERQEAEIAELRWFDADGLRALAAQGMDVPASLGLKALAGGAGFARELPAFADGTAFPLFSAE